jgi:type IV pilus assembly protein PilW
MLMPSSRGRHQRGLSLVELMVGITVGMFVVAAAATLVATQLTDNRKLLVEVQVQQDLRATADIIMRDLRRAGSLPELFDATKYVWSADTAAPMDFDAQLAVTPASGAANQVTFASARTPGSRAGYGFRLSRGVIQAQLPGDAGWQDLSDGATMTVTAFNITAVNEPPVMASCPKLCSDGSNACWPQAQVRSYTVEITGEAKSDAAVKRSVSSVARVRSDLWGPADGAGHVGCPA